MPTIISTGTDGATAAVDSDDHKTTITMSGAGIGGGLGKVQLDVVEGLPAAYPAANNNLATMFGTVEIANFFMPPD